jgi:hypothetical protein
VTNAPPTRDRYSNSLTADQALAIAQTDAVQAYRDLSGYCIRVSLEGDGWHIDYELKDPRLKGGGPHYVIDSVVGTITSKTYEQ